MANFTFHGIGGDYLAVSDQAHAELLAYLAEHQDIYWVDTFLNIMKFVKAKQATTKTAAPLIGTARHSHGPQRSRDPQWPPI
jgi:hypothetical protein